MMMEYREETIDDVNDEWMELFNTHYKEIAWKQDKIEFNPDFERYRALNKMGLVVAYTVREEGKLLGYAVWFINPSLHYSSTIWSMNDIIYIDPKHRGSMLGARLLRYSEEQLKKRSVQVMGIHIKKSFDWGRMAERLGYENVETSYQKWIGE